MYNPEIIQTLTAINKYTPRAVHDNFGIDYNKPFFGASINGRFTVNQILKQIRAAEIDPAEAVNIILIRDTSRIGWRKGWYAVTISAAGRVDIEHRDKYYSSDTTRTKAGFDWFFRKADFEDLRKDEDAAAVIISQRREDTHKPEPKTLDRAGAVERYKLIEIQYALESHGGRRYVHEITIQRRTDAGTRENIPSHGQIIYSNSFRPGDVAEVIDKSGYLTRERREELKRRARALKAEREKAAYIQTDDAEKVKELETLFEAKKAEVARALQTARTWDEMKAAAAMIEDYKTGLKWAAYDLDRYKQNTAGKKYKSIEAATAAYNAIRAKLTPATA